MSRTEYNCNPIGRPIAFAISQGALFHTAAQAAEAEAVFKKVLLEIQRISHPLILSLLQIGPEPVYPRIVFVPASQVAIVFLK